MERCEFFCPLLPSFIRPRRKLSRGSSSLPNHFDLCHHRHLTTNTTPPNTTPPNTTPPTQADDIRSKNAENPVIVYSKTYCPYCSEVKSLFAKLNVPAKVVEIDTLADADAVSAALADVTGRRTVPQVFIGGEHVGGCDDTVAANKSGKLKELLGGVGVKV